MSHEVSRTDQNPTTGRYVNRTGPEAEVPGRELGDRTYESQREADTAAAYRSFNRGESTRPVGRAQSGRKSVR